MAAKQNTFITYLRAELNLVSRCRGYHLPLWQCPQFLFVIMGVITTAALLGFYFTFTSRLDPYSVALFSLGIATFLLIQGYIILHAFERSAEANRMQAEFINIASHQLRSPVTAARWALDFLVTDVSSGLSAEAQNCVHIARDAIGNIGELVTAILRTVRIESGTNALRLQQVSLNKLISDIAESAKRYARAAHLELQVLAPKHELFVESDPEQLRFVTERLVDNALRYSRREGTITIELRDEGESIRVQIRDQGEGIPLPEQEHIFEKFFRASNAYTLTPTGAGLSLYVSHSIIDSLGGRMGFRSVPGQGTTFWFILPRIFPSRERQKIATKP